MPAYRDGLPQLGDEVFLTHWGLETDLIFHHGYDLPLFAAFVLLAEDEGIETLRRYWHANAEIARKAGTGFILESPTWRASRRWGERLGYTAAEIDDVNREAIRLLVEVRSELDGFDRPVVISGCVGPRGDGYHPAEHMTEDEARRYHGAQIAALADTEADLVNAMTLSYPAEATGIVRAAADAGMPVVVSFTVETDGALPDGTSLRDAISLVDDRTGGGAAYFLVNCAHPSHIRRALEPREAWTARVRGLKANASRKSHAELDRSPDLDDGDPHELGLDYRELRAELPQLTVLGGCCGTDHRHLDQIAELCVS